jgi:hypothetical protein
MKIEYLYGHTVTDVEPRGGVGFRIKFDSGNELIYEDSDVEVPEDLEGSVFTNAVFSNEETTLYFAKPNEDGTPGEERVPLTLAPMLVGVKDATGAVSWPARTPPEEEPLPPDPSPERIATGPEEDSEEV